MSVDPSTVVRRVTAGVDWAKDDHAVCVAGDQGDALERFTVRHDAAGLRQMAAQLLRVGVAQVGIERGDGPVIDTLLEAGLTVFVIPPGQVKNLCNRYGSAGNKDDRFDAYVLADAVRILARTWAHVIWRCWQDHASYDPAAHNSLQTILNRDQSIAA